MKRFFQTVLFSISLRLVMAIHVAKTSIADDIINSVAEVIVSYSNLLDI